MKVLSLYTPKQVSNGTGDIGSDEMSDIDIETNAMKEKSGVNGGLVGIK